MTQQNNNDVLADLEAELAIEVIEWSPDTAGEQVAGYITEIEYRDVSDRVLPILMLKTKDGSMVKVAAGRKVLGRELAAKKVQVGDAVGIVFEGQRETDSGTSYFSYRVVARLQGARDPGKAFSMDKQPDLGLVADLGSDGDAGPGF